MKARLSLISLLLIVSFQFTLVFAQELEKKKDEIKSETSGEELSKTFTFTSRSDFWPAFFSSLAMIFVSEIGDKTFFIAAILAMQNPRLLVFSAAFSALVVMTVLSAALGYVVPAFIPPHVTHLLSIIFFLIFGLKMLREYSTMSDDEGKEEMEEAEEEIQNETKKFDPQEKQLEEGTAKSKAKVSPVVNLLSYLFTPIWIQTFTLTFLAEWGDRSQITTIAMATTQNPYGISIGGMAGHAICTGVAVIGGRMLASKISVRTVTLLGAILFLIFAAAGAYHGPNTY